MSPFILLEDEVRANFQRRDLARDSIQVQLQMLHYEPSNAEVLEYLNLQSRSIMVEYEWVYAKAMCTSSVLRT